MQEEEEEIKLTSPDEIATDIKENLNQKNPHKLT